MKNNSESDYRQYIGNALGKVSEEIADQWLSSLQNVVNEDARDIFPTEEYLDHIPGMIDQIGRIIASEESAAPLTNSLIERNPRSWGSCGTNKAPQSINYYENTTCCRIDLKNLFAPRPKFLQEV